MLAATICGKARIGKAATSGGLVGTILTASGTGVGHLTTGSSLGTRGGTNGPVGAKLIEAFYATPNPSVHRPPCPAPNGYWHICYNHTGRQTWQEWVGTPLVDDDEDQRYLKGGRSGPKGNFHVKGVDKGMGKGIGKGI